MRAHTVSVRKGQPQLPLPPKWPEEVLVFDAETTLDTSQKLNFGAYRRHKLSQAGYQCVEEGLFYADDLDTRQRKMLQHYRNDPKNIPAMEVNMFPPQMRLKLYRRSEFVEQVFWRAMRKHGAMIVGFNLPFDLSRLAVKSCAAAHGGWSLVLSLRKSRKTGGMEVDLERPRVVIASKDSKTAFIRLRDILRPGEWPRPREGRFLDLRTLGFALRDDADSLQGWCNKYGLRGKLDHKPTGQISAQEIDYCRADVRATAGLLNAMMREFNQHPFELLPDRAYSPASVAKAYLEVMNIALPKAKFKVSDKDLGIAMQGYYGGRAECRIRKTPVPVVLLDFTSQYPTVNALLGNWDALTAESVSFEDCTDEVRVKLRGLELGDTFNPAFWKGLSFFALVLPQRDILPVRTVYNGRTQNIGINYLTSEQPIWFAGPDLVASALLTGKVPQIVKAIRLVPQGRQAGLKNTNLAGMVTISPEADDFFCHVIEQKSVHKRTNKPLAHSLKTIGTSGSYGLFVEVNQETTSKPAHVKVFSGEIAREAAYSTVENAGQWYFAPVASLITAGGRLLLAMLERCVADAGGSYLFCDTDSLCIVSSEQGGLVPCRGGPYRLDGREAIKALRWTECDDIAKKFNRLNPYDPDLVPDLLKIEDINFVDSDPRRLQRQVIGHAISAKRYVLYTQTGSDISIVKASGHGLGYLYPPKDGFNKQADASEWVVEAWDWLLGNELGLKCREPRWLDLPALMRISLSSPNIVRNHRPRWLAPFNFFFLPLLSDLDGYPAGCNRSNSRFIAPFSSNRSEWKNLKCINLLDGRHYRMATLPNDRQDRVVPETFRTILRQYLRRSEAKSLAPDGTPCVADTRGLLQRVSIVAGEIIPVGKETDRRWEQGEDMSMVDFKVLEYRAANNMVVADPTLRDEITTQGVRKLMRTTGLSQHTIEAIRAAKPVRRATLKSFLVAVRR
ncbi:MAG TPA: hypothetical protein VEI01_12080 [Terriglobales bacterium]|nr:hypothetical protein [Terriglobales bacterium]